MEENTPSTGAGATPTTPVPPATGTPAPGSATPPAVTSLTLEEAIKKLADLEHSHGNAKEELDRHRKKLSAYEKAEAERESAKKAAEEAQLSEIERIKKQHADIQAQHDAVLAELRETRLQHAVERVAHTLGFLHPEIAGRLLDRAEIEYGDNGTPKNVKPLLEKVLKSMPELARTETPAEQPAIPQSAVPSAPTRPGTPTIPAMNPGRTVITPPGQALPPGRPVRLADIRRR